MEGSINWVTVAVSWALSVATTVLLMLLSCVIYSKCSGNRKRSTNLKNFDHKTQNTTDCLDLLEWNSNKPLQTSSPLPHHHHKNLKHKVDSNNNNNARSTIKDASSPKDKSNTTQPSLLLTVSSQKTSSLAPAPSVSRDKPRMQLSTKKMYTSSSQDPLLKSGSSTYVEPLGTTEQELLRNKRSNLLTNTSIIRNDTETSRLNSLLVNPVVKIKTRSSSTIVNEENKKETSSSATASFITDLKESPTEKKRQSMEKLRRSRITINKSEDEESVRYATKNTSMSLKNFKNTSASDAESTVQCSKNGSTPKVQPTTPTDDNQSTKPTTTMPITCLLHPLNLTNSSEKTPTTTAEIQNSKLPPRPVRSSCSSHGNVSRETANKPGRNGHLR